MVDLCDNSICSLPSIRFALVLYIPLNVLFGYRAYGLTIIRMVPKLPVPQLGTYLRELFKKFPAGDAFQVFHDRGDG